MTPRVQVWAGPLLVGALGERPITHRVEPQISGGLRRASVTPMLTAEDYKRLSKQVVQLAIASEDPCVAQGLLQLALDYMAQVVSLSERAAKDQLRQTGQQDSIEGFGD